MVTTHTLQAEPYWRRGEYVLKRRAGGLVFTSRDAERRAGVLPPGSYARLLNVNQEDPEAVLEVVNKFGGFSVARTWLSTFAEWVPFILKPPYEPSGTVARADDVVDGRAFVDEPVEDVVFAIRAIRDFTRAWMVLLAEDKHPSWELPINPRIASLHRGAIAAEILRSGLTNSLPPSPRAVVEHNLPPLAKPQLPISVKGAEFESTRIRGAYQPLCAQLYNDLVRSHAFPRPCQRCGEIFTYPEEEPSAAHERQRPATAIYCTRRCNNAAAQQRRRDRLAGERRASRS